MSDPTTSSSITTSLSLSIEARRLKKRKAGDSAAPGTSTPSPGSTASAPPPATTTTGNNTVTEEWKPAPGESPAERERREKREKRALKLGLGGLSAAGGRGEGGRQGWGERETRGVRFDVNLVGPSGSGYGGQAAGEGVGDGEGGGSSRGMGTIHPDRMRNPALVVHAKENEELKVKEKKEKRENTPSKKKYLKRKKERSKGKKAGEPNAKRVKITKKEVGGVKGKDKDKDKKRERESDDSSEEEEEEEDEEDEAERLEKEEKRRLEIMKKKEERKAKRDAKKIELRKIKAEGGEVTHDLLPMKRVVPLPTPTPTPAPKPEITPVEDLVEVGPKADPTAEELEEQAYEAERAARKESKRHKRALRRASPPPPPPPLAPVDSESIPAASLTATESSLPSLIPTDHSTLIPAAPSPVPDSTASAAIDDPTPVVLAPAPAPGPLYRLPSATRPAPPTAKVLGELKVHQSVRDKVIVDPEYKIAFEDEAVLGVGERGRKRLAEMQVVEAFAVQTAVLPLLLTSGSRMLYAPFEPPQDVCVSAPTGSGKTLSYVIPIVETLSLRVVTRLRALVILPTRDLVAQVRDTFEAFAKGTGLKVGTAIGQHSFAHEQVGLVGSNVPEGLEGGSSQIDILIATPGRLMDHVRSTPGFSLQHLRYLVIDEADRLLNQSFHDWLPSILAALKPSSGTDSAVLVERNGVETADGLAPHWWDAKIGRVESDLDERTFASCQKLLFSATLSRDPAKIDALHLHRPIYISVEDALDPNLEDEEIDSENKFTLPASLTEHMIISPSTHKPLYLLHLLHTLSVDSALCFTKSVEAATRLAKLVEFFEQARSAAEPETKPVVVKSYSSELTPGERSRILASFKKGEIQMLICSDLISRGIDLPHVSHVISYDVPTDMRKYVHRVGRTARAGKSGDAWSLVEDPEVAPFKAIMNSAQHLSKLQKVKVKDSAVASFVPYYQIALEKLREHFAVGREKHEQIKAAATA